MAIKKPTKVLKKETKAVVKTSKKSVKTVKTPAKKLVTPVQKTTALKLKPAPKTVTPIKEEPETVVVKKTVKNQKIQTAEGWKRMMLKELEKKK